MLETWSAAKPRFRGRKRRFFPNLVELEQFCLLGYQGVEPRAYG
jgi:hypothetical protein